MLEPRHQNNQGESTGKELMHEAVDQTKQVSRNLASKASEKAMEAKLQAQQQIQEQKKEVVRQIGGVNQALRQTASNLDNPSLGQQLERLADKVETAADRLEESELEDIVEAAEDFSRSQPLLFLTGSFFAGMMVSRFLRATRPTADLTTIPSKEIAIPQTTPTTEVNTNEHVISR